MDPASSESSDATKIICTGFRDKRSVDEIMELLRLAGDTTETHESVARQLAVLQEFVKQAGELGASDMGLN